MKQLLFLALATGLFTACNNTQKNADDTTTKDSMNVMTSNSGMEMKSDSNAVIDPVCGMEKDSTWTDYTMYKGDTVWFCSPSEKDAFVANPEKYKDKLRKH